MSGSVRAWNEYINFCIYYMKWDRLTTETNKNPILYFRRFEPSSLSFSGVKLQCSTDERLLAAAYRTTYQEFRRRSSGGESLESYRSLVSVGQGQPPTNEPSTSTQTGWLKIHLTRGIQLLNPFFPVLFITQMSYYDVVVGSGRLKTKRQCYRCVTFLPFLKNYFL